MILLHRFPIFMTVKRIPVLQGFWYTSLTYGYGGPPVSTNLELIHMCFGWDCYPFCRQYVNVGDMEGDAKTDMKCTATGAVVLPVFRSLTMSRSCLYVSD